MGVNNPSTQNETLPRYIEYQGPVLTSVFDLAILDITLSGSFGFDFHIDRVCCHASQSFHVAHDLAGPQFSDVAPN